MEYNTIVITVATGVKIRIPCLISLLTLSITKLTHKTSKPASAKQEKTPAKMVKRRGKFIGWFVWYVFSIAVGGGQSQSGQLSKRTRGRVLPKERQDTEAHKLYTLPQLLQR